VPALVLADTAQALDEAREFGHAVLIAAVDLREAVVAPLGEDPSTIRW
jgi:hypothetical protein